MKITNNDPFKFLSKLIADKNTGCWNFSGAKYRGYGRFGTCENYQKKSHLAHRFSFSIFNGPLINGLVIDHMCRNRACCNPAHLRQVSIEKNVFENSETLTLKNKLKTHCLRGHEFYGHNLLIIKHKGRDHRRCRTCTYIVKNNRIKNKEMKK